MNNKVSRREMKRGAARARGLREADAIDSAHSHRQPPSFIAQYKGTCQRCYDEIEPGTRVHYGPEGIVHHRHDTTTRAETVCDRCNLVKPCDCD